MSFRQSDDDGEERAQVAERARDLGPWLPAEGREVLSREMAEAGCVHDGVGMDAEEMDIDLK